MENKVTILSLIKNDNYQNKHNKIKLSNKNMISDKFDFYNEEYWFWLNSITENGYTIGSSNVKVDNDFYPAMFKILQDYKNEINEAKSKLLDLFAYTIK